EALSGAKVSRDTVGAHNGLKTIVWQQHLENIPVFEAVLIGNISKNGELVSLASRFLPDAAQSADAGTKNRHALQSQPPVSVAQAILNAAQNLGEAVALAEIHPDSKSSASGYQSFVVAKSSAYSRLVWLPMNRSEMR